MRYQLAGNVLDVERATDLPNPWLVTAPRHSVFNLYRINLDLDTTLSVMKNSCT